MDLIKIEGVDIPSPSDYLVSILDISNAERNANGAMIIERIATKRKIELSWSVLKKDEISKLLRLVSSVFFIVNYVDPQDNATRTGTFYAGDRTTGMLSFKNGEPVYKDVKLNLIER